MLPDDSTALEFAGRKPFHRQITKNGTEFLRAEFLSGLSQVVVVVGHGFPFPGLLGGDFRPLPSWLLAGLVLAPSRTALVGERLNRSDIIPEQISAGLQGIKSSLDLVMVSE